MEKNTVTSPDAVTTGCLMPCGLDTYQYHLCYKANSSSIACSFFVCDHLYLYTQVHTCGIVSTKTKELFWVLLHICFHAFLVIGHLYIILYTAS